MTSKLQPHRIVGEDLERELKYFAREEAKYIIWEYFLHSFFSVYPVEYSISIAVPNTHWPIGELKENDCRKEMWKNGKRSRRKFESDKTSLIWQRTAMSESRQELFHLRSWQKHDAPLSQSVMHRTRAWQLTATQRKWPNFYALMVFYFLRGATINGDSVKV